MDDALADSSTQRVAVPPRRLFPILAAVLVALLLFAHAMFRDLDHDEHQFVASGALLARRGLLPYRDYPYFHVPYLVAIYALLFSMTDHLLLAARVCSACCSIAIMLLVAWSASRWMAGQPARFRRFAVAGSVLALLASPAVMATCGRAWNHDVPTLLTFLAFLSASGDPERPTAARRWALAGVLVGVATATRLTFAPAAGAFLLAALTSSSIVPFNRRRLALRFVIGFIGALAPCAAIFLAAPRGFIFGNLQYPMLNLDFREADRYAHGVSAVGKFRFIFTEVLGKPGNLLVFLLFVGSLVVAAWPHRKEYERRLDLRLLMLLIFALFIGALVPTPLYPQYFFTPTIFMMLSTMAALACAARTDAARRRWLCVWLLVLLISVPSVIVGYRDVARIGSVSAWVPMMTHQRGLEVAQAAQHGRVLTLAPIFPLEGRCEIYPELATGPFAWRVGPFVDEAVETRLKIWDPDDLERLLHDRPPSLVLIGRERALDVPLVGYADRHHIPVLSNSDAAPGGSKSRNWP